jgi:type VI secretion system protein ImpK
MAVQPVTPMASPSGLGGAGLASGGTAAYILDQFREFHDELLELRDAALRSGSASSARGLGALDEDAPEAPPFPGLGGGPPLPPPLPDLGGGEVGEEDDLGPMPDEATGLLAEEALRRLQTLLEMQALDAGRRGGEYGVLYYKEAQYVMAALADEIFLTLDWPGRDAWRADLLETRLFGTYDAGEKFYRRLETLLKTGDRVQAEIAVVYLMALTLGFRGRYGGGRHEDRILEYRRRLYYYIYRKAPDLADPTHRLSDQAYRHTSTVATSRMLPSPARWLWLLAAVVLVYLVAAHFVFEGTLEPLMNALDVAERGR